MCAVTGKPPVFECCLGDVAIGTEFHTPDGETWLVTSIPAPDTIDVVVVNIGNARGSYNRFGRNGDELKGRVTPMRADIKLGRDHKGMLYASTSLNDWYLYSDDLPQITTTPDADDAKNQADAACYQPDDVTDMNL